MVKKAVWDSKITKCPFVHKYDKNVKRQFGNNNNKKKRTKKNPISTGNSFDTVGNTSRLTHCKQNYLHN